MVRERFSPGSSASRNVLRGEFSLEWVGDYWMPPRSTVKICVFGTGVETLVTREVYERIGRLIPFDLQ